MPPVGMTEWSREDRPQRSVRDDREIEGTTEKELIDCLLYPGNPYQDQGQGNLQAQVFREL